MLFASLCRISTASRADPMPLPRAEAFT
jgi:hypothetical protein